ncbi:unnamed protein product [Hydatigera taeniaeformis]|uniref:BOS complex subunit TMEM147 n=1 Tax=Hydatigena taeniaeformis TaxID=6205 RepID=A0A0R3WQS5_HYDTA|nr:unnamed protein product [Hydatigera taeniaeformis]
MTWECVLQNMGVQMDVCHVINAEAARSRAEEEMESLKIRFSEALRDHESQQRAALHNTLHQSDTRLEVIRANLLMAEKKGAEASARASHAEAELIELTKRFRAMEAENKSLREEKTRLTEELKKSLAKADIQSENVLKKLTHFQEQSNLDEEAMRDSISLLRSQLREALERAERSQTELMLANEAQVRLLSQSNALEQRLHQIEGDFATANQCHEAEIKEVKEIAESQETQLRSALEQLTRMYEARMRHAEDLFNQQHRLLKKLREECRFNVEAFDLMVSQMGTKHQILINESQTAKEIAVLSEEERSRLYNETVEHLTQAESLSRQVSQLEQALSTKNVETRSSDMGFFYFFNCMALAGGPHIIAYKAAGLKEHDAFWRCVQVIIMYGCFQLARMFLATLVYINFDMLSAAGLFNYELLGVLINLLAVRFTYARMFGRSEIAVFLGCIGWSYGDLVFTKFIEQQVESLFYATAVKSVFALLVGFVGLLLKITWVAEAPNESKKQSDEGLSLFRHINHFGALCQRTIRNAMLNSGARHTTSSRRSG